MYNVSDNFKITMKQPAQYRRLFGTVGEVAFTQDNVLQGTFTITNQCSGTVDIQIGQAYIGELKATFRGMDIPRSNWKSKEITVYQGLKVNEQFEDVLLGHYFVDSAKWTRAGIVITAYDAMSKFDRNLALTSSSGSLYDFIMMCCETCNVEFGMTQEEISSFTNGGELLGIHEDNEMETYRDFIAWIAQTAGANATINREGKLIFRQYQEEINDILEPTQRLDGGKYSDFDTFYTGMSIVNMSDATTTYYGAEVDNGLTMNLGSNPLLQLGLEEVVERQRLAVLDAIQKINYTSSTMRINSPLIYDLMDVVEFPNGIVGSGNSLKVCVTKYTWNYNGNYEIECVGSDPSLASGKSKVDKNLSGLINQVEANKTVTYRFTNAQRLSISESFTEIINIVFTSKEKITAHFLAEILLQVTANALSREIEGTTTYTDSTGEVVTLETSFAFEDKEHPIIEVNYYLNNELISTFIPKQIYHEGEQILTLYYPLLSIPADTVNTFTVMLKISGGAGVIEMGGINATIFGQGLVAALAEWDGRINIEEYFTTIPIINNDTITVNGFTENVIITQITPTPVAFTESFGLIPIVNGDTITVNGFTDTVTVYETIRQQPIAFELSGSTEYDENKNIQMKTNYVIFGENGSIDYGKINIAEIITSDKQEITELTIGVV